MKIALVGSMAGYFPLQVLKHWPEKKKPELAIWTEVEKKSEQIAHNFGGTPIDSPDRLDPAEFDGLLLSTLPSARPALARRFIEAGVPVYLPKRIAPNRKDTIEILQLAQSLDTPILTGSPRYFAPAVLQLEQMVRQDKVGAPALIRAYLPHGFGGWEGTSEGGIVSNYLCHTLDPVLRIVNARPIRVNAMLHQHQAVTGGPDVMHLQVMLEGGCIVSLEFFGAGVPLLDATPEEFTLHGTKGSVAFSHDESDLHHFHGKPISEEFSFERKTGCIALARAVHHMFSERIWPMHPNHIDWCDLAADLAQQK